MGGFYSGVLSVAIGLGLAAACGFRVFIPLLALSVAARSGAIELSAGWEWLSSFPALLALSTATALEIGAYYVPWIDNLLDTAAAPAAVAAGALAMAALIPETSALLKWSVAIIAGGGAAGAIQAATTTTRAASTVTTGGVGNPVVSTAEAGGAAVLSLLAVLVPLLALALALVLVVLALRLLARVFRRRRRGAAV